MVLVLRFVCCRGVTSGLCVEVCMRAAGGAFVWPRFSSVSV